MGLKIFFGNPPVGSGNIYNDSVVEAVSAVDSTNSFISFNKSVTESVTATDTVNRIYVGVASISETTTATDTTNKFLVTTKSIAEPASATDTTNRGLVITSAQAEPISATDTIDAVRSFLKAQAEPMSAIDTVNWYAGNIFTDSVVEPLNATDASYIDIYVYNFISTITMDFQAKSKISLEINLESGIHDIEGKSFILKPNRGYSKSRT